MFLDRLQQNNPELIKTTLDLFSKGVLLPDTYVLDYDAIMYNASKMKEIADQNDVRLFYMLKQIGRNPLIAKGLDELGFDGCVAVDYKEALLMKENNCKLAHVGHLVQIPINALRSIISAKPDYITVYSIEMVSMINDVCKDFDYKQNIILRIVDEDSDIYPGQVGGFSSLSLSSVVKEIENYNYVSIAGLTVFPALLYDANQNKIVETINMKAMNRAKDIMKELGYNNLLINMPSCTCCNSIPYIKELGGNCGEPGHGLTGTTPLHKESNQIEKIGYLYLSEISHNFMDSSYCYGGGHYRRSHIENCLIGYDLIPSKVISPDKDSIDYHFQIKGNYHKGEPVIMCFRTQVFTTRSYIVVVKGISRLNPEIIGIYNSLGEPISINWR